MFASAVRSGLAARMSLTVVSWARLEECITRGVPASDSSLYMWYVMCVHMGSLSGGQAEAFVEIGCELFQIRTTSPERRVRSL